MKTKIIIGYFLIACYLLNAQTVEAADKVEVYIDAGHGCMTHKRTEDNIYGFTAEGATGEAEYVDTFTKNLISKMDKSGLFDAKGIDELYTKEGIKGDRRIFGNDGRIKLFRDSDCDMLIQIHYDESADINDTGGHVIYAENSKNSKYLAEEIAKAMEKNNCRMLDRIENHISERNDLSVYINPIDKPVVLVELGFGVRGKSDYEYLRDKNERLKLYKAIIEGAYNYRKQYIK